MISIGIMAFIVIVVMVLLVYMLVKYRASKLPEDYEPPHIEGSPLIEGLFIGIQSLLWPFFRLFQ